MTLSRRMGAAANQYHQTARCRLWSKHGGPRHHRRRRLASRLPWHAIPSPPTAL